MTTSSMRAFYKGGGELVEAKRNGTNTIDVITKFSSEQIDSQNDSFAKSAWDNKEDVNHFMKKGFADWNHLYPINKKLAREALKRKDIKAYNEAEHLALKSIVGQPERLWFESDGPYCKLKLYADNEFIKSYEPALKASSDRFGVSAAGLVLEAENQNHIKTIKRARLSQISICPLLEAINDDTTINIVKSSVVDFFKGNEQSYELKKSLDLAPNSIAPPIAPKNSQKNKLLDFILTYLCTQSSFRKFLREEIKRIYGENHSHTQLKSYFKDCFYLADDDAGELAAVAMVDMKKK